MEGGSQWREGGLELLGGDVDVCEGGQLGHALLLLLLPGPVAILLKLHLLHGLPGGGWVMVMGTLKCSEIRCFPGRHDGTHDCGCRTT